MNPIPQFLIDKLNKQYGKETTNKILDGYKYNRKPSLRVNTIKSNINEVKEKLDIENITYQEVSWYKDALILDEEKNIRDLDIYNDGKIYMQSLSSMIPPIVLEPKGEKILDMTASPGGKTTQIYNLSNKQALITAVEKNKIRSDRLRYNLDKQGTQATILNEDATKLDEFFRFDKILLDAPCSGSGTLNINNKSLNYFNEKLINNCINSQEQLLNKAIQILKPNETMVYSTCSILYEENEQQLEKLLKQNKIEIVKIDTNMFSDIELLPTKIEGTICICPNNLYEGFFVSRIRKL